MFVMPVPLTTLHCSVRATNWKAHPKVLIRQKNILQGHFLNIFGCFTNFRLAQVLDRTIYWMGSIPYISIGIDPKFLDEPKAKSQFCWVRHLCKWNSIFWEDRLDKPIWAVFLKLVGDKFGYELGYNHGLWMGNPHRSTITAWDLPIVVRILVIFQPRSISSLEAKASLTYYLLSFTY